MNDLNKELLDWAKQFETYHLPRWEELPTIEFYMDQVIEYINKYVGIFNETDNSNLLTSTMINNYVKLGLIPPPQKKRYSNRHIANLIVITIIKQVCVISQIREAIVQQMQIDESMGAYNLFCNEIEKSVRNVYEIVKNGKIYIDEQVTIENMAVKNISQSLSSKILAVKTVETLRHLEGK